MIETSNDIFFAIPSKTKEQAIANPFGQEKEKEAVANPFVSTSELQKQEEAAAAPVAKQMTKGRTTISKVTTSPKGRKIKIEIPDSISKCEDDVVFEALILTYKAERERRARLGAITELQCREDIARAEKFFKENKAYFEA